MKRFRYTFVYESLNSSLELSSSVQRKEAVNDFFAALFDKVLCRSVSVSFLLSSEDLYKGRLFCMSDTVDVAYFFSVPDFHYCGSIFLIRERL